MTVIIHSPDYSLKPGDVLRPVINPRDLHAINPRNLYVIVIRATAKSAWVRPWNTDVPPVRRKVYHDGSVFFGGYRCLPLEIIPHIDM